MKPQRLLLAIGLAGVCLLLSSCVDSKNPLSDPEKAQADPQLAGVWRRATDDGATEYFHVGIAKGSILPGIMRAIGNFHGKDGKLGAPLSLLLFATSLGESRYLNVVATDEKKREHLEKSDLKPELVDGWLLMRYQVQGDTLEIWPLNPDAKRRAIQAGRIKGTIDKKADLFTETTEKLASLLASPENADLFEKEPVRYQRVK
jgi:hypothetical protein